MEPKESKELLQAKVFSVAEETFELNGSEVTRFTVRHPGAAVFLPRDSDGLLLFVEQFRAPIRTQFLEAPAGTLEPGEAPIECARREIQEEVGYAAAKWTPLGELVPAPGFCDERQHLYLAEDLSESVLEADEDEDISVKRLTVEEALSAIDAGRIQDAKSIALIFRARLKGLF